MALCTVSQFQNLTLFGASALSFNTHSHSNLSFNVAAGQNHYAKNVTSLEVCEVVITYTHPGYNDEVNTIVWLPMAESWSGRFLGAGGGGWVTGAEISTLAWAASEGFAVATTDGGHAADSPVQDWALLSPGNVNWVALQNFASTTLDEAATLGKAVVEAYYGTKPSYSYWNGCSTGGRQGHMMAQRYPDQYDGILASASAMQWGQMLMQEGWPQAIMNNLKAAATIAKWTWKGATSSRNESLWYGLDVGASFLADAATTCSANGTCTGSPLGFFDIWVRYFLTMDPDFDISTVNVSVFSKLFHQSVNRYDSIIGTSDIDLTYFKEAGGKLITWHGLADSLIAPNTTVDYAQRVYERDPEAEDYYRFFEAPGVDHCGGGSGWFPGSGLQSLINWVERGVAPTKLEAQTQNGAVKRSAHLCLWPKSLHFVSGDVNEAGSFECH
ncbi:hypothetical protein N0V87_008813 [Didymella glomerata]|uniref:Carboxylic ester hydrolase n=1 Tax=Didymella glomerata TaxID=749621 RepID=A0A9W8WSW7_9PLEO|nr:hypothetical protein N0V87_008813 [Didymella glomerata]